MFKRCKIDFFLFEGTCHVMTHFTLLSLYQLATSHVAKNQMEYVYKEKTAEYY
jgi:hypothetical protein